jgi:hypothetical protein
MPTADAAVTSTHPNVHPVCLITRSDDDYYRLCVITRSDDDYYRRGGMRTTYGLKRNADSI